MTLLDWTRLYTFERCHKTKVSPPQTDVFHRPSVGTS